ncbi:peptidoglycan-binding domain-containing protein [Frigidibacter oleivorans]|uniref:peptidoglycan-binding domain-containing protein n=1 Tax=Frigidibacter oleivorans TaxID=2487129 RepID=UPI001F1B2D02|nr:peptidoglycan-binding domain-containing protein [Frigidibacter oleivorans]
MPPFPRASAPRLAAAILCAALAACVAGTVAPPDPMRSYAGEAVIRPLGSPAPAAEADSCWGEDVTPAVIETVTEQVLHHPAELAADGSVITPASYRTETRQRIVRERAALWVRTPCPADLSPDVLASLQRALAARGLFDGPPTGTLDAKTRRAIRRFQAPRDLDSGILSMAAAVDLGIMAVGRDGS